MQRVMLLAALSILATATPGWAQDPRPPIRDGEIVTACQAVCPTEAIVFGDVNDPNSRVSKLKESQRNYSLLGELNTKPRTTYLTQLKNPNPEIESGK